MGRTAAGQDFLRILCSGFSQDFNRILCSGFSKGVSAQDFLRILCSGFSQGVSAIENQNVSVIKVFIPGMLIPDLKTKRGITEM